MDKKTLRSLIVAFIMGFGGAMLGWLLGNALHLSATGRILLTSGIIAVLVIGGMVIAFSKKNPKV